MNKFADLEALVAVVESGSFSAASERLNIAKSVVSRRISQLEERLGSKLLYRTTRRLSLTDNGREFHLHALQILNDLEDAEQQVGNQSTLLQGRIKLAAPLSFGLKHLSIALSQFTLRHPDIHLDIDLNDRETNLIEEGFDMAIRVGDLEDSSMIAKRLSTIRRIVCASPSYLEEHGTPEQPSDLNTHKALQYSYISVRQQWRFWDAENNAIDPQPKIVMRANNGEALATAACAGVGITCAPTFILNQYCQSGELIPILQDYLQPEVGLHAIFPSGRLIPQRMRKLAEYLAKEFGDQPYWDDCECLDN